jgi:hypothetical protein
MSGHDDSSMQPIAGAAKAIGYFERSTIHRGKSEIRLGKLLSTHPQGHIFNAMGITTTVKNYTIENALSDVNTGLLFQGQTPISETSYFEPSVRRIGSRSVQIHDGEDLIMGFNRVHDRYQHWLTQCIPAIDWSLRQERKNGPRLLLPPLANWQRDILYMLGYGHIPNRTLHPDFIYHLPKVEYSEFLNGTTSFGVCLSALDTARNILARLPSIGMSHRMLYVPCPNPYYGAIQNEEQVINLLRRHGVFLVDPKLPTADRINLFRKADVVIGPVGPGLTDIMFCRRGTLLWEWMPWHHQNASFNRLAQAAEVDYWGDMFESGPDRREWLVDIDLLAGRLSEITERFSARIFQTEAAPAQAVGVTPLDEVLLAFESLGDNCEFGLVQRQGRAEPLGLFRFAGMSLPKIVRALEARLSGIGTLETIEVFPVGDDREYMVRETWLDTSYHTFHYEDRTDPEDLRQREAKRLAFLRRKLLDDLATGEKIWVWRGETDPTDMQPLLKVLRSLGPNILFSVVSADVDHPAGTVEWLDRDFMRGYVERLAPHGNIPNIRYRSWFETCENAFNLCRSRPEPPSRAGQG